MTIKNQVQLITYPDSLGGDLKTLNELMLIHCRDVFSGVHILPPFPSSGDRGFAPMTYFEIEPKFGTWDDVRRIGQNFDVLVDVMVNHISRQSKYFKDFAKHGRQSQYADLFITLDKIWPSGEPPRADVARIFLRRPDHPFTDIVIEDTGKVERVWATFGRKDWSEQIDLDIQSPATRQLFIDILAHMSRQGVKILRLDAVAYVNKKPGTSCFFVEPDLYQFMDWVVAQANAVGIELLPEVHAHYSLQDKLAAHGYWVYNFVLPGLILYTLLMHNSRVLKDHLKLCPRRQFTTLDCHDGIPVQPDLDDVLEIDEAQKMVKMCLERGANLNRILSEEHKRRPDFDAHQINITYYSALDANDDAYIAARALQFFSPGVPQVYYAGFLAGKNDQAEFERAHDGRAINRHNYTVQEVDEAVKKPVVQRLMNLIRFRNQHPAFNGGFKVLDSADSQVKLTWQDGEQTCNLIVDLETCASTIHYTDAAGANQEYRP